MGVTNLIFGGSIGYLDGITTSSVNVPFSYGLSSGPLISVFHIKRSRKKKVSEMYSSINENLTYALSTNRSYPRSATHIHLRLKIVMMKLYMYGERDRERERRTRWRIHREHSKLLRDSCLHHFEFQKFQILDAREHFFIFSSTHHCMQMKLFVLE